MASSVPMASMLSYGKDVDSVDGVFWVMRRVFASHADKYAVLAAVLELMRPVVYALKSLNYYCAWHIFFLNYPFLQQMSIADYIKQSNFTANQKKRIKTKWLNSGPFWKQNGFFDVLENFDTFSKNKTPNKYKSNKSALLFCEWSKEQCKKQMTKTMPMMDETRKKEFVKITYVLNVVAPYTRQHLNWIYLFSPHINSKLSRIDNIINDAGFVFTCLVII